MGTIQSFQVTIPQEIVQHWGWFLAFGIALVVLGVAAVARSFSATILFGVVGFLLVTKPVISAETLTLFMAMFFLVSGLFQFIAALVVHVPGWGWQAADGAITFVLGLLVLAQWPVSGLWAIGLFIGIDLIFFGARWIALALDLRAA